MDSIFHDVQQNTLEWMELRTGKLGGSSIGKVMANFGKSFGPPAHDLAVQIAIEQLTGKKIESQYTNSHMERGHIQEPIARALYEENNFVTVSNGGFFDSGDLLGVSPDGLVDDDGGIEIKSVIESVHFANIKRRGFDPAYKWQIYAELLVSGREWWDFVSFCETFPPGKKLYQFRIFRNEAAEEFAMIQIRVDHFKQLVYEKRTVIENFKYVPPCK